VANQIPLTFRSLAQRIDRLAGANHAQISRHAVERAEVRVQDRRDRVLVQRTQMVGFEKRVDHELPVKAGPENARLVVAVAHKTKRGEIVRHAR